MKSLKTLIISILIALGLFFIFKPSPIVKTEIKTQDITVIKHDTIVKEETKIKYITPKQIEDQTINDLRVQTFRDSIGNQATLTSLVNGKKDSTISCKLNVIEKYKTTFVHDSIYKYINTQTTNYVLKPQPTQLIVGGSVGYNPFLGKIAVEGTVGLLNSTNIIPTIGFIQTNNLYLKVGIQVKLK